MADQKNPQRVDAKKFTHTTAAPNNRAHNTPAQLEEKRAAAIKSNAPAVTPAPKP